jgi:hypothetical protein
MAILKLFLGQKHRPSRGLFARNTSFMKLRPLRSLCGVFVLLFPVSPFFSRVAYGADPEFPLPKTTGVFGTRDNSALLEITAFLRATSGASWQSLDATGTLMFPDGDSHQAELHLKGAYNTRLDITMETGIRSFRVTRSSGVFRDERGNGGTLQAATSATELVAFPRIWTDALSSQRISLFDHGTFASNGHTFHRLTIEYALSPSGYKGFDPAAATDLYFDPTSHLLLYSVDAAVFNEQPNMISTRITEYNNYQAVNGILIPTLISEVLDGQPQWVMQLNTITTNTLSPDSTFSFED